MSLLLRYIKEIADLRGDDNLIISHAKPHKAVHVDVELEGIDIEMYKPHSTRAAATSKAKSKQVPINHILQSGMWSNTSTFAKFYDKTIVIMTALDCFRRQC